MKRRYRTEFSPLPITKTRTKHREIPEVGRPNIVDLKLTPPVMESLMTLVSVLIMISLSVPPPLGCFYIFQQSCESFLF